MVERVSQAIVLGISDDVPVISKVSQLVVLSVSGPPFTPSNVSQAVVLAIVNNKRGYVSLESPIPLPCFNPCNSYGTTATIIYLGV